MRSISASLSLIFTPVTCLISEFPSLLLSPQLLPGLLFLGTALNDRAHLKLDFPPQPINMGTVT